MSARHFSDRALVARYTDGPPRSVPGLAAMHRVAEQLLGESVPDDGRVLVVGAGGGMELAHFAAHNSGWTFDGVDPSPAMLDIARQTMGPLVQQTTLHLGYAADAPAGPFDAATCLLTLHFVEREERLRILQEIHRRLRPGAPLLTFHYSAADGDERLAWLRRAARFAGGRDLDQAEVEQRAAGLAKLPILTPEQDEDLLREAGFDRIETYFAALAFRGWLAYA